MRIVRFLALWVLVSTLAVVGGSSTPARAGGGAGPTVSITADSADINTDQSVGFADNQNHIVDKSDSDFLSFGRNILPPDLTSTAGKAGVFAQQASTITGPTTTEFPGPLETIGVSGRARSTVKKNNNDETFVPFSDSVGELRVEFTTTGPTPFVFAGSLTVSDDPKEDCSHASATLTNETTSTTLARFQASQGEQTGQSPDCDFVAPPSVGFDVSNVLQAGDYTLDVEWEAGTIDPEVPGQTQEGTARVDVSMQFFKECSISGTSGPETLTGTTADETICGFGGNDRLIGGGGADLIFAGAGNDVVTGGAGRDEIHGGAGDDTVSGGPQGDLIFGESGADGLTGDGGPDTIDGGPGRDGLSGGIGTDTLKAKDGTRDTVGGGPDHDVGFTDRNLDTVTGVEEIHH